MDPVHMIMAPAPGSRLLRFTGDCLGFSVERPKGLAPGHPWRALLRTNLGRAEVLRQELIQSHAQGLPFGGACWRDVPMHPTATGWHLELPLAEVGFFKAKAYLVDEAGWQHWPDGPDVGVTVHPDRHRTANTLYCAFPRLLGASRNLESTVQNPDPLHTLDGQGYTVIPPSGKLRDLTTLLPHIFEKLGCRILHLLPVNPTPTTYARFGRFGSPYASLDLRAVDPALVEFDKRATGIDQFRELTYAAHSRGGRVFLDIVINHTGWGSVLQENHPEWFVRKPDGTFVSPGAWGNVWADLVELRHVNVALWDDLAETFLVWCRRGVDGFRCDAGYMVPVPAWQYIIARVQQEFPETVFLLEGLGGAWEATEALLTEGGMQWAYSELFQNYSGTEVAGYADHSFSHSECVGVLVHYSETHDNERLAAKGKAWSLLRNRLAGLCSVNGGFGFTSGVEWLATEKIRVHGSTGLNWDSEQNIIPEIAALNRLLADHPCFFDGVRITRVTAKDAPVQAWLREAGQDQVLVIVNTLVDKPGRLPSRCRTGRDLRPFATGTDLLGQKTPGLAAGDHFEIPAGAAFCLATNPAPAGLPGEAYRTLRAQADWGLRAVTHLIPAEQVGTFAWQALARLAAASPEDFLTAISHIGKPRSSQANAPQDIVARLSGAARQAGLRRVVTWELIDRRKVTLVPPGHWLVLRDPARFRASLVVAGETPPRNLESIQLGDHQVVTFPPRPNGGRAELILERYAEQDQQVRGSVRYLDPVPQTHPRPPQGLDRVLLTNGRGAMARLCVDLGRVSSKYDCVLGANLHPELPVDRHVLAKRIRVWVNADGFISPLDGRAIAAFRAGPPAVWDFLANAGDGRTVEVQVSAQMLPDRNCTVFQFSRPTSEQASGKQLPADRDVRLTVRLDLEDRGYHGETRRNGAADHHFNTHTRELTSAGQPGFVFAPAPDRQVRTYTDSGRYYPQPEWSEDIPHPVEQTRGQVGSGDAWSPGWFDLPLPKGANITLLVTADPTDPSPAELESIAKQYLPSTAEPSGDGGLFRQHLEAALRAFVVRRGEGKTVIAGYPWFLDWGRDTFICARGLIAAGWLEDVRQIVLTFARFEQHGTLPNTIFGADASNRDTSDAPLWFAIVCDDLCRQLGQAEARAFLDTPVDPGARTLRAVIDSIATHYIRGTPNGIRMDPASGLIWSPSHFTWMDTNYPAGTPRQGYPVEIQALWVRLLRWLRDHSVEAAAAKAWSELAQRAEQSIESRFWLDSQGYYADVLLAEAGTSAAAAVPDDSLRSNSLFLVSLGISAGERAQRCVEAARRHLVIPGGLRSLAPLPVTVPLRIQGAGGQPLNNPHEPYWGHYEGDEDTRRKPAYHNGTAWTWTFPVFCEALALAWNRAPEAVAAARAYLGSAGELLGKGCLGQLPEVLDGDAPHTQRGCDAQAWAATETLRVWLQLNPAVS